MRAGPESRPDAAPGRGHPFSTWHWSASKPVSLPRLQSALERLPSTVYRAKGIVHLEELPDYQISLQMVGKRYNLRDSAPWDDLQPSSDVVLIAEEGCLDPAELKQLFDGCLGTGDESASPILRLCRRIGAAPVRNWALQEEPLP